MCTHAHACARMHTRAHAHTHTEQQPHFISQHPSATEVCLNTSLEIRGTHHFRSKKLLFRGRSFTGETFGNGIKNCVLLLSRFFSSDWEIRIVNMPGLHFAKVKPAIQGFLSALDRAWSLRAQRGLDVTTGPQWAAVKQQLHYSQ